MIKQKIVITIGTRWGSEFQKEFALNLLNLVLEGWSMYLKNRHKKNDVKLKVDIETDYGLKVGENFNESAKNLSEAIGNK